MSANSIISLTVLFELYQDDKVIAHCLELDLVINSITLEQAKRDIDGVIRAHLDYASRNNISPFDPAPKEFWDKLKGAVPLDEAPNIPSNPEAAEYPFVFVAEEHPGAAYGS